jgi:putative ABC transport system permease protein
MGVLSGLLALPLGWAMSEILIHVINLRSFGWSMNSFIPQGTISSTLVLSCTAAFLAALYPVWRLNRMAIAGQLRDE